MKALVKFKKGREGMELKDVPEPIPKDNEIKIKVLGAGICGTDIHIMNDEYSYNTPVIMGHEYVGIIDEVGKNVTNFKKGNYVISLTAAVTCGKCRYCREGLLMLCDKRKSIGSGINGAFAEYMTIPADIAFKVPDEIENKEDLAICEPFACIVRGIIERSSIKAGDLVLISGPGTMGLLALQVAKIQGAHVIVSGIPLDENRLKLAKELGADIIVSNPSKLSEIIKSLSPYGAYGVDVAIECSGVAVSARSCIENVRKRGIYTQVGLFGKEVPIDMDKILYKELTVTNSFASERTSWEIALRLLKDKKVNLRSLISAKIPLKDWEKAFDMVLNKEGFKIVLVP